MAMMAITAIVGPTMTPILDLCPAGVGVGVGLDGACEVDIDSRVVIEAVDDTGTEEVAVLPIVLCPTTVCKVPWVNENTSFPAAQSASPLSASGLQAKTLFPQGTSVPSLSFTGSLRQKSPHTVEFHLGSVHVPRIVVPAATV